MKTTAQLTFEKVRHDEAKDAHLVVSLEAPRGRGAGPERLGGAAPVRMPRFARGGGLERLDSSRSDPDMQTQEEVVYPETFERPRRWCLPS
jgi:hypothetical protein